MFDETNYQHHLALIMRYNDLLSIVSDIDLSKVIEIDDNTNLSGEVACAGGACEVSYV